MDSTKVVVMSLLDSTRVVEHVDVDLWTYLCVTLVFITVLVIIAIIIGKLISCLHEYRMFMASRPRIIVKKIYIKKKGKVPPPTPPTNGQPTSNTNNSSNTQNGLDGVIVINNTAVSSNKQSDNVNLTSN